MYLLIQLLVFVGTSVSVLVGGFYSSAALARTHLRYTPTAANVIDFQPYKTASPDFSQPALRTESGALVRLVNLNPNVGSWYILDVTWPNGDRYLYNLNRPSLTSLNHFQVSLDGEGISLSLDGAVINKCRLFDADSPLLHQDSESIYSEVCGILALRRQGVGTSTGVGMSAADTLRGALPGFGDAVADWGGTVLPENGEQSDLANDVSVSKDTLALGPKAAQLTSDVNQLGIRVPDRGLPLVGIKDSAGIQAGRWYPVTGKNGIFFSALVPQQIAPEVLLSYPDRVNPLDSVEQTSTVYLVGFDLAQFEIGWSHGTIKPGIGWSPTQKDSSRDPDAGSGPDGFSTADPLTLTGVLNPELLPGLAATMCGGFERRHGFFRNELGDGNNGNYWGFIEDGVILSSLNPGAATAIIDTQGNFTMKTWTFDDNVDLAKIRHARQNVTPLIEGVDGQGVSIPGKYVNTTKLLWSGTAEGVRRSIRAGACLQDRNNKTYLIYAYFSAATPSVMARTFQSLGCKYAMHLDMNSPAQAYLGLVNNDGDGTYSTSNPNTRMASSNTEVTAHNRTSVYPRFVGAADNSDFFYFINRRQAHPK